MMTRMPWRVRVLHERLERSRSPKRGCTSRAGDRPVAVIAGVQVVAGADEAVRRGWRCGGDSQSVRTPSASK